MLIMFRWDALLWAPRTDVIYTMGPDDSGGGGPGESEDQNEENPVEPDPLDSATERPKFRRFLKRPPDELWRNEEVGKTLKKFIEDIAKRVTFGISSGCCEPENGLG